MSLYDEPNNFTTSSLNAEKTKSSSEVSILENVCRKINEILQNMTLNDDYFSHTHQHNQNLFEGYQRIIRNYLQEYSIETQERLHEEYFGIGPLKNLLINPDITEIIVNHYQEIWVENQGKIQLTDERFLSPHTFNQFLQRLYLDISQEPTLPHPFINASWRGCRIHLVGSYHPLATQTCFTLRKQKQKQWNLSELENYQWASPSEIQFLKQIIHQESNFLVLGPTGSGKTSVLQSMIQECSEQERIIILEDTPELIPSNGVSTHLLTRFDTRNILPAISLSDLVKQSLRMRPDRLIVGEVRGEEAKDLLLALATGHKGSAGTFHAADPHQALIRLEMLIQMGAPNWSLEAIRRLIWLSLQYLIVCNQNQKGQRMLGGIYKIVSLENSGIIIERLSF